MSPLDSIRLYGIIDLAYVSAADAPLRLSQLLSGGVGIIQLRAKQSSPAEVEAVARRLLPICREAGVPFVLNDHVALARDVGCDGVHLGQDDMPVDEARGILGTQAIIGLSTHDVAQARQAMDRPVDYIGFGPLFATQTKPDYQPIGLDDIRDVHTFARVPVFCIGGIKLENLPTVRDAGARRVVIVSGLLLADDPADYARQCLAELQVNPI